MRSSSRSRRTVNSTHPRMDKTATRLWVLVKTGVSQAAIARATPIEDSREMRTDDTVPTPRIWRLSHTIIKARSPLRGSSAYVRPGTSTTMTTR
jgi:hypothetical protein